MPSILARSIATILFAASAATIGAVDAASAQARRAPARAAPAPAPAITPVSAQTRASIDKLKTVIQAMGYDAKVSPSYAGTLLVIAPGKLQYNLDITPSVDGAIMFLSISFSETPAAASKYNYVEILKQNNVGANFFSTAPGHLIVNRVASMNDISPKTLRTNITSLVGFADQTSNLWSSPLN